MQYIRLFHWTFQWYQIFGQLQSQKIVPRWFVEVDIWRDVWGCGKGTWKVERAGETRDPLVVSIFQFSSILYEDVLVGLKKMGKKQLCQMLRVAVLMAPYCPMDGCMYHLVRQEIVHRKVSIWKVYWASYIELMLETKHCKSQIAQAMSRPSVFERQALHQCV